MYVIVFCKIFTDNKNKYELIIVLYMLYKKHHSVGENELTAD